MELYTLLPGESIELRAFQVEGDHKVQTFVPSWEALYEASETLDVDYDVYFGVCPRVPGPDGQVRGGNRNVQRVPVLWLDLDAKGSFTKEDRLAQIEPWKPTYIVDSGSGFHIYWLLAEDTTPQRSQRLLKALSRLLECDDTSDPARILRVPGTANHKHQPCRFVDVVRNGGPTHHIGDLEGRIDLPTEPESKPGVDHAKRIELLERFGLGQGGGEIEGEVFEGRDAAIFEVACHFRDKHFDQAQVVTLCESLNSKFTPPLPKADVHRKVASAFTREAPPQISEVIEAPPAISITEPVPPTATPLTEFTVQSMNDILAYDEPPTEWMAEGVLARGHIVYTMNPPKSGKTTIALNLALRMAAGKSGAGLFIEQPYRVLFLQPMGDMHPTLTREWVRKIGTGLKLSNDITFDIAVLGERSDHFKYLHEHAHKYDLVMVDTISRLFPAVDDKDTRTVSEELDKIRRLRMMHPHVCWLYLVQVGKNSLEHLRGSNPGFAARGNSAIAEVFDDALQIIVPTNDIERDEELGLNLTRHIVMMGRGASQYRRPWRTRFDPETHVIEWVQDLTYDEAVEAGASASTNKVTKTSEAADLLGRMFLDAFEETGERKILATEAYRIGEENGHTKRVMKLALASRGGTINPARGPKAAWWDGHVEVTE